MKTKTQIQIITQESDAKRYAILRAPLPTIQTIGGQKSWGGVGVMNDSQTTRNYGSVRRSHIRGKTGIIPNVVR